MNKIIINDGKERASIDINRLRARRKAITENLEKGRIALVEFLEREVDMVDLKPLLSQPTGEKAKEHALKWWLLKTGQNVPQLNVPLSVAITTPDEVYKLLVAFEPLGQLNSKDPSRYWNAESQQFFPLEVSKEEETKIVERNRVYMKPGVDPDLAKFTYNFVALINYGNRLNSVVTTPAMIRQIHPYLVPILEFQSFKEGVLHGLGSYHYEIKKNVFTVNGGDFVALDELPIIQTTRYNSF